MLFLLARLVSLALALTLTVAAVMFWSTSNAAVKTNGLICLLALLIFAALPREYLAVFLVRLTFVGLAIAAQIVNVVGLLHSIRNIAVLGTGSIFLQAAIAILLLAMLGEALAIGLKRVAV
jgi:hypothetical protein